MTSESGRNPAKRLFPDGRHPEVRRMVAGKRGEVSISALTLAEAMFGAKKKRSQRLESLVEMFREMFDISGA